MKDDIFIGFSKLMKEGEEDKREGKREKKMGLK